MIDVSLLLLSILARDAQSCMFLSILVQVRSHSVADRFAAAITLDNNEINRFP